MLQSAEAPLPPWSPEQTLEQKAEAMKSGRLLAAVRRAAPLLSQQQIGSLCVQLLRIEVEEQKQKEEAKRAT